MSIRCAHCKGRHNSVAKVKDCAAAAAQAKADAQAINRNWAEMKAEAAVLEQQAEDRAYEREMAMEDRALTYGWR
jgi:hypothetical protein